MTQRPCLLRSMSRRLGMMRSWTWQASKRPLRTQGPPPTTASNRPCRPPRQRRRPPPGSPVLETPPPTWQRLTCRACAPARPAAAPLAETASRCFRPPFRRRSSGPHARLATCLATKGAASFGGTPLSRRPPPAAQHRELSRLQTWTHHRPGRLPERLRLPGQMLATTMWRPPRSLHHRRCPLSRAERRLSSRRWTDRAVRGLGSTEAHPAVLLQLPLQLLLLPLPLRRAPWRTLRCPPGTRDCGARRRA